MLDHIVIGQNEYTSIKTIEKFGTIVECEAIAYWNINDWLNSRLRELNLRFDLEAYAYFLEAIKSMEKI